MSAVPAQTYVMDASALLALARGERGADLVQTYLDSAQCVISSVNLAEVGSKLIDLGLPESELPRALKQFNVDVIDFEFGLAVQTSALRDHTKAQGLSLGDRACLALALQFDAPAVTANKAWQRLDADFKIKTLLIR
ncbi:MAG: type II toxin-antitoxin system VapC family toxin [Cytophagales bacterium]|nr:type II toxin-antitoxin system VapC family toxin [Cytophagales bacterium]